MAERNARKTREGGEGKAQREGVERGRRENVGSAVKEVEWRNAATKTALEALSADDLYGWCTARCGLVARCDLVARSRVKSSRRTPMTFTMRTCGSTPSEIHLYAVAAQTPTMLATWRRSEAARRPR